MSRERWQRGILCRVGDPVIRGRAAQFSQEDLPPKVAWLVQEAAAEFEVFSMREPPHAIFATVGISEHLGHAGAIGTAKVEGDMDAAFWDVLRVPAIHRRAA